MTPLEILKYDKTDTTFVEVDCGAPVISTPSDAILSPRPVFSNGFETPGQIYRFGDLDDQGYVSGVFVGLFGDGGNPFSNCARGVFNWTQNGGRDNGAFITSVLNTRTDDLDFTAQHEGSYIAYSMPGVPNLPNPLSSFNSRSLSHFCGFRLNQAPTQRIAVMGLGNINSNGGSGTHVAYFTTLTGMYLWIDPDLNIGCHVGGTIADPIAADYTLGVAAPLGNWFALEFQGHNGTTNNAKSGFALAQLYTLNGSALGIPCIRSIGIPTHATAFQAWAVGADVAMLNGGMSGLDIDDLQLFDNLGTTKRLFGSIFVGNAKPIAAGDSTNSIISFDSTHIISDSAAVPVTAGSPTLHGDPNRWKNVNGLLNQRPLNEQLFGAADGTVDISYGAFSAFTGHWVIGPFSPGRIDSVAGDAGTGPFDVVTMENNIIRNTFHDQNIDLYQVGIDRIGIVQIEGIQFNRRTAARSLIGGVFQQGVSGAYTDLFSYADDFCQVIPDDTAVNSPNLTLRRMAKYIYKDANGTYESPSFNAMASSTTAGTINGVNSINGTRPGAGNSKWSSQDSFVYQPSRSYLDIHPVLNQPFNQLDPSILQSVQIGLRGDFSFYDADPTPLPGLANHRWIRFEACELGFDYTYRKVIPVFIEHAPFPPIACLLLESLNRTTRVVSVEDQSDDWDGVVVSATVNWGDGSATQTIVPEGGTLSHTYATPGIYTITDIAIDNNGLTGIFTLTPINAFVAAVPGFTETNPSGNTIDFIDASTAHDETISGWHWDFGDGNTSTSQNPNHTYTNPGTYTVVLTLTTNFSGSIISAPVSLTVPIPVSGACNPSADFMADTADVVGDNYHGDNLPLPNYANTAAFDAIYEGGTRLVYSSFYATINDGIEHKIDTVNQFNGHNTYDMVFGKPGATTYQGAGWQSRFSNDAHSGEAAISVTKAWIRARFETDAGIVSESLADTDIFEGLEIFTIEPTGMFASIMVRNGHLFYDDNDNIKHLIGNENLVVGVSFVDVLMLYDGTTHTAVRQAIWIASACDLSGTTPLLDITNSVATSADATFEASNAFDVVSFFNSAFNPSGSLKHLRVADFEIMPFSVDGNPFSVNGI